MVWAGLLTLIAVTAFAGWMWTAHLTHTAEREYPPVGKFVMVHGLRMHFVDRGPTRPDPDRSSDLSCTVVLLHGAFSALQDFTATVFDELAQSHRVIALDRPGHGYSDREPAWTGSPQAQAAMVREALAAMGISRAVLVGFSYGGAVALAHALEYPTATEALVLLAAPTHPWADPIETEYFVPTWPLIGPLLVHTLVLPLGMALSHRGVTQAFYPLPVAAEFAASPFPLALRPASFFANAQDLRVLKASLRQMSAHYGSLEPPVTIVHGTLDHVVGIQTHSDKLKAQAPAVKLIPIPGAGHQILFTHPRIAIDAILSAARESRFR